MGRRISRLTFMQLKITLAVTAALLDRVAIPSAHATAVFDAASCARMGEMLSNGAQQLSKLQGLSSELQSLNAVMGTHLPASATGALGRMGGLSGEFAGLLNGISSPYADSLSSLNAFSSRHGAPDFSRFIIAKDYIKSKLFAESGQPLSVAQHDEIRQERTHVIKESSINSVALASQQKNTIKKAHQQIEHLGQQALESPTIHDDLRTTNQLLAIIATELVQQRAILAQQLELNAAVIADQMPLVFKSTSLARPTSQHSPSSANTSSNPWGQ